MTAPTLRPVVFLDRDGTVIENVPYLADPDAVRLIPGVGAALVRLARAGWARVLVSNQSGVGRGLLTEDDVRRVNARVVAALAEDGARLDGVYYCPHAPDAGCDCRKPKTGMARRAAAEMGLDLSRAVVVGDDHGDMGLAEALGVPAYLVRTGHGVRIESAWTGRPGVTVVDDLPAATVRLTTRYE